MMVICIKQHLTNIWSSIHEKVKQHWGWVEAEMLLIKKACRYLSYCEEDLFSKFPKISTIEAVGYG